VHGRLVDLETGAPIAGASVTSYASSSPSFSVDTSTPQSDADGAFVIPSAPSGDATIVIIPGGRLDSPYDVTDIPRTIAAGEDNDLGALRIPKRRVKLGGDHGTLGLKPKDRFSTEITAVVPDSAAAAAGIVAGDVITTIDGVDVTGPNSYLLWPLASVPPGQTVALGLARGAVVKVTAR
jgi:hypothetical protein